MSMAFDLPMNLAKRCVPPAPGIVPSLIFNLGLAELGGLGRDDEVAHHRQFAPASERETGDPGYDRFPDLRHVFPGRDQIAEIGVGEGLVLNLLDVGACRERFVGAGQYDRADSQVGLEGRQRRVEVGDQAATKRVERLGAV
jgi:hypothetical protein